MCIKEQSGHPCVLSDAGYVVEDGSENLVKACCFPSWEVICGLHREGSRTLMYISSPSSTGNIEDPQWILKPQIVLTHIIVFIYGHILFFCCIHTYYTG